MRSSRKQITIVSISFIIVSFGGFSIYKLIQENYEKRKKVVEIISSPQIDTSNSRIDEIISLIQDSYVDSVNVQKLKKNSIQDLINSLDPHSDYLSPQEVKDLNLSLGGSFGGIGVEYYLLNDTLLVTNVTPDGPAQRSGIKTGDKILKIGTLEVSGKHLGKHKMTGHIKGKNGSIVDLLVLNSSHELKKVSVQRKKIHLSSIDVAYMITKEIGYIKISSFGENTNVEFLTSLKNLKAKGMKKLIMDLRENGGGYFESAVEIADQFLEGNQLIVYTKGAHIPRSDYVASGNGNFKNGELAILIDENTASAGEIVAGAIKDQNRGVLIGRRTFGKGLIQEQFEFKDGSALNLTVARYYTPSGKSIQKPYKMGKQADYDEDLENRLTSGALSIDTLSSKIEGGISPNVFVKLNTEGLNIYYAKLVNSNMISNFTYGVMTKKYSKQNIKNVQQFEISDEDYDDFVSYAKARGIHSTKNHLVVASKSIIKDNISQLLARYYFGENGFYQHVLNKDSSVKKAVDVLSHIVYQ